MARLTAAARKSLPASDFADPAHRKFPMQDKAHVAAAESYSRYASPAVKAKIAAKASKTFHKKKGRGKPFKALLK